MVYLFADMCIYLTLPTYKHQRTPKYRDEGREETFQQNCLLCILLFRVSFPIPFMDEKHVQYIQEILAPYNVISL